ncbi:hypothetical protein BpHYR1_009536 [Brachionus plicatilis]|uniref:Uncharacterized protein n=1 Tax=Brachionus plicatilis TaxID=10195 RepID=A0A3M7SUG0_BRAPC|nr:hypothetical protein BpHYR1_009536 [Brachionus plicatilis]
MFYLVLVPVFKIKFRFKSITEGRIFVIPGLLAKWIFKCITLLNELDYRLKEEKIKKSNVSSRKSDNY